MNEQTSYLQIRIYKIDGTAQTFTQNNPELVNRTLRELNPTLFFTEDRIKIADDDSEITFLPSQLTQIDLITDRLSVWDFPFVLGAPVELTESEFMECLESLQRLEAPGNRSDMPVFLDLKMAKSQRSFLWMEVAGGLRAVRMHRIHSMLRRRHLIFGLRMGGIGVLNLANLTDFSIHPKPLEPVTETSFANDEIAD